MHAEAVFLAGYAVALIGAAAGLERLGRRPTDPWSSPLLAASRPRAPHRPGPVDWPHSEVPQLHLGLSGVALSAALVISMVSLIRHHTAGEVIAGLAVLSAATVQLVRLVSRARHHRSSPAVDHHPFAETSGDAVAGDR